jgi:transposase
VPAAAAEEQAAPASSARHQSDARQWRFARYVEFAKGIVRDRAAVEGALQYRWSNGVTEGHVNRLKMIKRTAYGRASFELLRQRVLAQV